MRRAWGGLAVLLGLALLVSAAPGNPARAAAPGELTGFEYVAVGDSYSAGFGLVPFSATSPFAPVPPATENGCYQAESNYPHQVAAALGLALDDRTCSGAISANLGYPAGTTIPAPPAVGTLPDLPTGSIVQTTMTGQTAPQLQTAALSATTDIVTFAIGGNDLGFADIAEACIRLADGPGTYATGLQVLAGISVPNCRDYFDDAATYPDAYLRDRLATHVVPRIDAVLEQITTAAPNAQVFVVGYPQVATGDPVLAAPCFRTAVPPATNAVPFSGIDVLFIHEIQRLIDDALAAAAAAHGAHFIDLRASTAGHALCDADPWIAGMTMAFPSGGACPPDYQPLGYDGNIYVCAKLGVLHPNAAGVDNLAAVVTPVVDAAFGTSLGASSIPPGTAMTITGRGYAPGEPVEVVLHSTPVSLGTFTADASGGFSALVTVPADVAPGAHTTVSTGLASGRAFSSAIAVELAASGLDAALPLTLGLVLVVGGVLLLAVRRRPAGRTR